MATPLQEAATAYREACLREAEVLTALGWEQRGEVPGLMLLLTWHTYACDAVQEAKMALLDAAQGAPIWTGPNIAPGAMAVQIH